VSFEPRYHRFVYISDASVLNERARSFPRVKRMLYLFLPVVFLWRGYSTGSHAMLGIGAVAGSPRTVVSIVLEGSMSF